MHTTIVLVCDLHIMVLQMHSFTWRGLTEFRSLDPCRLIWKVLTLYVFTGVGCFTFTSGNSVLFVECLTRPLPGLLVPTTFTKGEGRVGPVPPAISKTVVPMSVKFL